MIARFEELRRAQNIPHAANRFILFKDADCSYWAVNIFDVDGKYLTNDGGDKFGCYWIKLEITIEIAWASLY